MRLFRNDGCEICSQFKETPYATIFVGDERDALFDEVDILFCPNCGKPLFEALEVSNPTML